MLNVVRVQVAPLRNREGNAISAPTGSRVSFWKDSNPLGTGGQSATLANVYLDRYGVTALPNPMTMDLWGGVAGLPSNSESSVFIQFFTWEDVVHLTVAAPNGVTFTIPNVQCTGGMSPNKWIEVRIHDLYNDTAAGAAGNNSPIANFVTAGVNQDYVVPRVIAMYNTIPAADKACWAGEDSFGNAAGGDDPFLQSADETVALGIYGRPMIIEGSLYTDVADGLTATAIAGISMGYSPVVPIASSPTRPLVLLYQRWDTPVYELLLAKGSGTSEKLAMTGLATPTVALMDRLRIVYVPGQYVEGFVNGKSGGRITTASKFPSPTTAVGTGYNAFYQSGSSASGNLSVAVWHARYLVRMP